MKVDKFLNFKLAIGLISLAFLEANAQDKNVDIYGNIGYTLLNGFGFESTNKVFKKFNGFNVGVSALYAFENTSDFKFVLGSGLNITQTKNQDTATDIPNANSINAKFNYTSIVLNSGIKYAPNNPFMFYLLGNLGYALANTFNIEYDSNDKYVNYSNNNTSYTINRHYYFGATLMGAYKITDLFSLGGNLIYNIHSMDLDYKTYSVSTKERSFFNEYSANIVFMWSI